MILLSKKKIIFICIFALFFLSFNYINYFFDIIYRSFLPEYINVSGIDLNKINNSKVNLDTIDLRKWERSNQNNQSLRFSSLKIIHSNNVKNLKPVWEFYSNNNSGNIQANPIFFQNKIFIVSVDTLYALEPDSGKIIWERKFNKLNIAKRGLTSFFDKKREIPIIVITSGDEICLINANNGNFVSDFGSNGKVILSGTEKGTSIPMPAAPIVLDNQIIVSKVNDYKKNSSSIISYDFYGNKKWEFIINKKYFFSKVIGGNAWGGISADEKGESIYITTGNPYPIDNRIPNNQNLYSNSIICIDAKNGQKKWHFQEVSRDLWDLDISMPPIISQMRLNNKIIDVVIVVSKLGNIILLDRKSGKNIFDWKYKKAPPSEIFGEITSHYQPYNVGIPNITKQIFEPSDIDHNENYHLVLKDKKYGFFVPPNKVLDIIYYGPSGGASWPGGSYDPFKSILYVSSMETSTILKYEKELNSFVFEPFVDKNGNFYNKPPWGYLNAIDLENQKIIWRKPLGDDTKNNILNRGTRNFCAPVATRGELVFCGGTQDRKFRAFNSLDGEIIWEYELKAHSSGAPLIYEFNSRQYILVAATGGNYGLGDDVNISNQYISFSLEK